MKFYSDSEDVYRVTPILEIGEYCSTSPKDLCLRLNESNFTGTYSWDKESGDYIVYPNVKHVLNCWKDFTFYVNGEMCKLSEYSKSIDKKGCLYNG